MENDQEKDKKRHQSTIGLLAETGIETCMYHYSTMPTCWSRTSGSRRGHPLATGAEGGVQRERKGERGLLRGCLDGGMKQRGARG